MSYGVRRRFYNSKAWKDVRINIWLKQNCLCARCGKPCYVDGLTDYMPKGNRRIGIVHHIKELNNMNVYDDTISLNEENLIGVCKECHEILHQAISIRKDYRFDDEGNLILRGA